MIRRCPWWTTVTLSLFAALPVVGQPNDRASDESFFADRLYPLLHTLQCDLCHNDNGVASETTLEFPPSTANREQITAFGLKLLEFVDREHPEKSLLLLKPTNREEHTGGERIKPGGDAEKLLLQWVNYLAGLSPRQIAEARERIAAAERFILEPLSVRRLTHSQYNRTMHDLLGDQSQPANNFPKEDFIRGFKNQTEGQGITPLQAEAYSAAAERLAAAAFRGGDTRDLVPGEPESPLDTACAEKFIRQFGLKVYRRPLREDEVTRYVRLFQQEATRTHDFYGGAKIVVEVLLQSPHFLFRVEQETDQALRSHEVASRLSYFLWDTMPSDEMLAAAARGEYATKPQIEAAVRRMLDDPRAKHAMDEFLGQWMRFDRVLAATRDRRRFRDFNSELAAAMVEETRQLFHHLVWEDRNFMEFFTADYTFVNADLARLYDLPAPAEEFAPVRYPAESGRAGVLGHGTFLVLTSKPAETSPTARGLFVRNHFLGHEVPPPPPGVNTMLPEVAENKPLTNRQRLAVHLNSAACSSCHRLIDPIGFGFEQYNAIGAYQPKMSLRFGTREKSSTVELDLDTTAHIQGIPRSEFDTPRQLGQILAANESCQRCIVKQLFRYTFGREETANDRPMIDAAFERFRGSGFQFRELIVSLATSKLFLAEESG